MVLQGELSSGKRRSCGETKGSRKTGRAFLACPYLVFNSPHKSENALSRIGFAAHTVAVSVPCRRVVRVARIDFVPNFGAGSTRSTTGWCWVVLLLGRRCYELLCNLWRHFI